MTARTSHDGARALEQALRAQGGTLAEHLVPETPVSGTDEARPGPAQVAASGPSAAANRPEYELLIEMIIEGSRLHYGGSRVVLSGDPDLALLLGDQLYALGLARLAELGDLDAVQELADVISLVAQAHASDDGPLAEAVWQAGAVAIGWGGGESHRRAKRLARAGRAEARTALLQAACHAGDSRATEDEPL